jgi:hypothetical protein
MQRGRQRGNIANSPFAGRDDAHHARPFDPLDGSEAGVVQDVGGFAGPRRLGADARPNPYALAGRYFVADSE